MEKKPKNKGGRPSKYNKKYCEEIIKFFDVEHVRVITETITTKKGDIIEKEKEVANPLPTIEAFAHSIKVNKSTIHEWVKKYPEFSNAYKNAKDLQLNMWIQNSMMNLYAQPFTIFAGKNMFGWRDKQEITGDGVNPVTIIFKPKEGTKEN